MNTRLATLFTMGSLALASHSALAIDRPRLKVDACVKAFITVLSERYNSETKVQRTIYPMDGINSMDTSELKLTARNPHARQKFVAEARCTVTDTGQVLSLQTERFAAL
jgi:hypothetical protein